MTHRQPARTTIYRTRIRWVRVIGLLLVVATLTAALGSQLSASSSSTATAPTHLPQGEPRGLRSEHRGALGAPGGPDARGALGEADGALPDGATVFDDLPGVAKLDPALLGALRRAANDAAGEGVDFHVVSGWRSPEYQERLLHDAVLKYGSEAEASRWVASPDTSPHVSGGAVDVGPSGAAAWLSAHGAVYGLCQIYGNEPWHFELRPAAVDHGCPAIYADPTHDPRMQR